MQHETGRRGPAAKVASPAPLTVRETDTAAASTTGIPALVMIIRSTTALAALLLAATPAHAQRGELAPLRTRVGIVGGASVASMTETQQTRNVTGAYAGAQLVLRRSDFFSIQLEAAWSQKGVRAAGRDVQTGESLDVTLRNAYVELPILLRLDSPLAIGVEPYGAVPFAVLGPSLGVSARCTVAGESAELSVSYDCDDDFGVKTFDFGAMLGLGLEAAVGRRAVSVGARYTMGLQDVFEARGGRNRALVLLAGVNF